VVHYNPAAAAPLFVLHVSSPPTLNAATLTQRGCPAASLQIFKSYKDKPFLQSTERTGPLVSLHARLCWEVSREAVWQHWAASSSSFICRVLCADNKAPWLFLASSLACNLPRTPPPSFFLVCYNQGTEQRTVYHHNFPSILLALCFLSNILKQKMSIRHSNKGTSVLFLKIVLSKTGSVENSTIIN